MLRISFKSRLVLKHYVYDIMLEKVCVSALRSHVWINDNAGR
jgi:hypothetical protein